MRSALLVLGLAACTDEVPATPSFQQHVAPILAANCARCHLTPAIGGAPSNILFFGYGDPNEIATRVSTGNMPPLLPLDDDQIAILERWAEQGGQRGEPRPDNQRPQVRGVDVVGTTLVLDMFDPDGDLFGGLLFDDARPEPEVVGEVQQGRTTIFLEANRAYTLRAQVDDGGAIFDIDVGGVRP